MTIKLRTENQNLNVLRAYGPGFNKESVIIIADSKKGTSNTIIPDVK